MSLRRSRIGAFPMGSSLTALLARDYEMLNQFEKAETMALRAVELRRSTLGEDHPLTMSAVCILDFVYVKQQQLDKAKLLTEQVIDLSRRLPLEKSVFPAGMLSYLGGVYLEQGDVAQADILCDVASQLMRRNPAIAPVGNAQIHANLGAVRLAQQKYAEATTLLREGLRLSEKHDLDAGFRFYVMNLLGASLAGQKNHADAEPLLLKSYQGLQQRQANLSPHLNAPRRITESLERLVQLYDAWGKPAQAAGWKQKLAAFKQANEVSDNKSKPP